MTAATSPTHETLLAALEAGELTQDQLRTLIAIEAERLGLTFDEAVERAQRDTLPQTPQGFDLQFHVLMLAA
jgi:hypothetical protein